MLTRIRRLFQGRPKYKPLPPGEYVAVVRKVTTTDNYNDLLIEFVVPGLEDRKFSVHLPPTRGE